VNGGGPALPGALPRFPFLSFVARELGAGGSPPAFRGASPHFLFLFFLAPRALSGRPLLCHCVTAMYCQAGARPVLPFHCMRFFLAPRAMSGRLLRPSRPQLRPACACDRAGTDRRADPRCSPPSHETPGRGQRLHPPVWPFGARTLRRNGSVRPRGGVHHHPLCREPSRVVPPSWVAGVVGTPPCTSGGENSIRQAGASGHSSGGCGSPSRRPAVGYRWRGFIRTARGPTAGRPCSVAAGGVSARRERGRASDERSRTRLARKNLTQ